jgi:O-antigen ligase
VWALRGFVLGLVGQPGCWPALNEAVALPAAPVWNSIIRYDGNKSLANAVQMALAAGQRPAAAAGAVGARGRVAAALLASGLLLRAGLACCIRAPPGWSCWACAVAGLLHQPARRGASQQLVAVCPRGGHAGAGRWPAAAGRQAARAAGRGGAGERLPGADGPHGQQLGHPLPHVPRTTAMIAERPLLGWGIGGWSTQWRQRVDGPLTEVNMPHNDFLWMGAQAGVPGALALLWLLLAGWPAAWRRHDLNGCLAAVALLAMLLAVLGNSALRDASMGLSLWFIVLVIQRLASQPQPLWQGLWPGAAALPARR